jgi:hypothetical protein
MIKKILFLIFVFINSPLANSSSVPPDNKEFEFHSNIRLFQKIKKFNFLLEYSKNNEREDLRPQSIRIGGKYRLGRSFKVGLYLRRTNGQRYEDDWVWENGEWKWINSENRNETHSQAEIIYRAKWHRHVVFELRNLYEFNHFNDQQTYLVRPGINYFHIHPGWPEFNLFAQLEARIPLNYSDKTICQQWLYFGGLYHYSRKFLFGPFFGYRTRFWTTSRDAKNRGSEPYEVEFNGMFAGINFIFRNLF